MLNKYFLYLFIFLLVSKAYAGDCIKGKDGFCYKEWYIVIDHYLGFATDVQVVLILSVNYGKFNMYFYDYEKLNDQNEIIDFVHSKEIVPIDLANNIFPLFKLTEYNYGF